MKKISLRNPCKKHYIIDPPIEVCQANSNHPPKRGDCDTNIAEKFNWCRNIMIISWGFAIFFAFSLMSEMLTVRRGREFYEALPVEFMPRQAVLQNSPAVSASGEAAAFIDISTPVCREPQPFVSFVDFENKRESFPSIIGWIQSEGTIINYPIVQASDNNFYLNHLPDGTSNKQGSVFLDYRNAHDFSDTNIFIYAHNMRSGDMFGTLKYYKNPDYAAQHPSMSIFTPGGDFTLQLFAGYVIPDSRIEQPPQNFESLAHFESVMENLHSRSVFTTDTEVNFGDTLVFLCTCTERGSVHERLIVVGKLCGTGVAFPAAAGVDYRRTERAEIDFSNTSNGYVMVRFLQKTENDVRVRIVNPAGAIYTYHINAPNVWETFPLSGGNGVYDIGVFERVTGNQFATVMRLETDITLIDEFAPFLRPNQFVNFYAGSRVVLKAAEIVRDAENTLENVARIYAFVVENIEYDFELAATVRSGYVPDLELVLERRKGICFDYAALMTAMLRSRGIPTKLVIGYAGNVRHAWINVHTTEYGWVNNVIWFDGERWHLMDPTFSATANQSESAARFIGDGINYNPTHLH
ncbi:MAG: sortase [Defluviitaleaceae bacterium]|nr:sortase [Defluviitaleaceae bacterium]